MRLLLSVVVLLILAVVATAASLTLPAVATPIASRLLAGRATVERAWVGYEPAPVAHLRAVEIEGRGHAEVVDARLDPLGVLPGAALVPRLAVTDGALLLELGPARSSEAPRLLDEVVGVDLERVRLDIHRPGREPQVFTIATAEGDLPVGAFTLEGQGGGATITMQGDAEGLTLEGFKGRFRVEGDNFAGLAALLGFAGPDTPAYALSGDLARSGETWRFTDFGGDVGDSDLGGVIEIDFAGDRPFVRASLASRSLDFDDLGVIVGAPSDVEDAEPNQRQETIEARYGASDRLIPDTELDVDRLHAANADVRLEADAVQTGRIPLAMLDARILVEDAVLRFEQLVFTAPQGRLDITGEIDARDPDNVAGTIEGSLSGFELAQIGGGSVMRGQVQAEFEADFTGRRTREAFANADGQLAAWSTDAEIRALAEEAAGLDVGEVLALMVDADDAPEFRPAECLAVRVAIEDGVARLEPAVLDTADSVTRVDGTVDLGTEAIDLEISSDAKDLSWGALVGGASVTGTLRDPELNAPLGGAAAQTGAAALLSGLTVGLAALPFVEPGLGEDAPCGRLLALARTASGVEDVGG